MNHPSFLIRQTIIFSLVALVFACVADSSEGQLLRRFRDNVRRSVAPQRNPAQTNFAPQQYRQQPTAPQVQLRPAIPQTNTPDRLTPYARLTPTERGDNSATAAQPGARIKVVTYLDPRTGRTFQRRHLVSDNGAKENQQHNDGSKLEQAANGRSDTNGGRQGVIPGRLQPAVAGTVPSQRERSLVPPINFVPQPTQSPAVAAVPEVNLPVLSGPTLGPATGPVPTVSPVSSAAPVETLGASINASIDDGSRVEMASSETAVSEIPDLSGITVTPAPVDSQAVETFFAEDEVDETLSGDLKDDPIYSVLETEEE